MVPLHGSKTDATRFSFDFPASPSRLPYSPMLCTILVGEWTTLLLICLFHKCNPVYLWLCNLLQNNLFSYLIVWLICPEPFLKRGYNCQFAVLLDFCLFINLFFKRDMLFSLFLQNELKSLLLWLLKIKDNDLMNTPDGVRLPRVNDSWFAKSNYPPKKSKGRLKYSQSTSETVKCSISTWCLFFSYNMNFQYPHL